MRWLVIVPIIMLPTTIMANYHIGGGVGITKYVHSYYVISGEVYKYWGPLALTSEFRYLTGDTGWGAGIGADFRILVLKPWLNFFVQPYFTTGVDMVYFVANNDKSPIPRCNTVNFVFSPGVEIDTPIFDPYFELGAHIWYIFAKDRHFLDAKGIPIGKKATFLHFSMGFRI
ncbi:MAG: hypothetical protein ACUVWP_05335 [bacterium]